MFGTQFDSGEATWLPRYRSQVFDRSMHATGDIDHVTDLDIVERHREGH
jgi:hypothetical protein